MGKLKMARKNSVSASSSASHSESLSSSYDKIGEQKVKSNYLIFLNFLLYIFILIVLAKQGHNFLEKNGQNLNLNEMEIQNKITLGIILFSIVSTINFIGIIFFLLTRKNLKIIKFVGGLLNFFLMLQVVAYNAIPFYKNYGKDPAKIYELEKVNESVLLIGKGDDKDIEIKNFGGTRYLILLFYKQGMSGLVGMIIFCFITSYRQLKGVSEEDE